MSRAGNITLARAIAPLVFGAMLCGVASESWGLGQEAIGNDPVPENEEWSRGVVDAVNLPSRVYSVWVNGDEHFCYRGDTAALTEALRTFAAIESKVREVILRPGPGEIRTFDGDRIPCDWRLQVPSGIYLGMARLERGTSVFVKYATMTVFVSGDNVEREKLQIPKGITIVEPEELRERYRAGLESPDPEVKRHAKNLLRDIGMKVDIGM